LRTISSEYAEVQIRLGGKVKCLSPLRGKEFLKQERELKGSYAMYPLSTDKGITFRDHWHVKRCDLVLANLAGATRVSIGTVMEIAWAHPTASRWFWSGGRKRARPPHDQRVLAVHRAHAR
jgi:hypothetical protein